MGESVERMALSKRWPAKGSSVNWIEHLQPLDLAVEAPQVQLLDLDDKYTIDDAAALMVQGAPRVFMTLRDDEKEKLLKGYAKRSKDHLPPKEWWPKVKQEFHIFLCTDDKKYEKLRKQLKSSARATSTTILPSITAAIGSTLGFPAGAITGLVALCLYGLLKIGKEAYCANVR